MLSSSVCLSQMIVGYYPNYQGATFTTIQFDKLTHLHYFALNPTRTAANTTNGTLWIGDPYSWFTQATYNTVRTAAETKNPNIKIIIVTGGAPGSDSDLNARLEQIGNTPSKLNYFCNNIIAFMKANGCDGWDLDWEYPNTVAARTSHQNLLAKMRTKFDSTNLAQCTNWTISITTFIFVRIYLSKF